jgi:hypothetical protein
MGGPGGVGCGTTMTIEIIDHFLATSDVSGKYFYL